MLVLAAALYPQCAAANDATRILKAMSDYVTSQESLSFAFESDVEVITPDLQKLQFASSGTVTLARPDKLHASRTGGYTDVDFTFDGQTAVLLGKNVNLFTTIAAPGTTDALFHKLRDEHGVNLPGADILSEDIYDALMTDVVDAKHIGRGVVDGVECEHLAFRTPETDWQIWIEVGDQPLPRKYIITSKSVAGAPQYTLAMKNWKTGDASAADAFTFKAPSGAKEVDLAALPHLDEIPETQAIGEAK